MSGFVRLSSVLAETSERIWFRCPACGFPHGVTADWNFDWNAESPTFRPSVKVEWENNICHSYVTAGRIEFLSDCTHAMAGSTVELPQWDY